MMKNSPSWRLLLFSLLISTAYPNLGRGEPTEFKNVVTNSVTGEILSEKREWIYFKERTTETWKRLFPGKCPQWHPNGKSFFYFLDVGYGGSLAELWQANADGEARLRCSRSDYFVHDSPVVSTNGQKLAYYYWTCRASGDFRDIVVIDLKGVFSDQAVEAKVVFRTHRDINPKSIRWLGENMIEFIVQGRRIEIDTSGKGTEQLP